MKKPPLAKGGFVFNKWFLNKLVSDHEQGVSIWVDLPNQLFEFWQFNVLLLGVKLVDMKKSGFWVLAFLARHCWSLE